eukprot:4490650-Amphidinium_carterae.1
MSQMFWEAWSFNCNIKGWKVCSAIDLSDMFCDAKSFSWREKLQWPMLPPACGQATRNLAPGDVSDCLHPCVSKSSSVLPFSKKANSPAPKIACLICAGIIIVSALLAVWNANRREGGEGLAKFWAVDGASRASRDAFLPSLRSQNWMLLD